MHKDNKNNDSFEIIVDHRSHDCSKKIITGREIKEMAGVDLKKYDVWQKIEGPGEDTLIKDCDEIDLSKPNRGDFFTGVKSTTEG